MGGRIKTPAEEEMLQFCLAELSEALHAGNAAQLGLRTQINECHLKVTFRRQARQEDRKFSHAPLLWSRKMQDTGPTCVLWRADTVAVTLLVHGPCSPGCGQSPVCGEGVGWDGRVGSVECPLAGVAVSCCGSSLCIPPGGGICKEGGVMCVCLQGSSMASSCHHAPCFLT